MYNWENSKSKSNSKSNSKHKHCHHDEYDPKNPTCSSSFFNKFNKSLKTHYPKSHQNEDSSSTTTKTPKNRGLFLSSSTPSSITTTPIKDEKMSTLRRACLVEKWMEKKGNEKRVERDSHSSSTTLLDEFDLQDALFFSTTTTTNTTTTSSSSSSSEIDYSVFSHPKPKPKPSVACFTPSKPKPIKTTRTIESKFINQFGGENGDFMKDRSKAANFYSNLKNLKQPISPGVRLSSFINSLFAKDGKNRKKKSSNNGEKQSKTEEDYVHSNSNSHLNSYSSCSSVSSFSRSCMSKKKKNHNIEKFQDDGLKRTVRFCPVSVIVDDDSQACGYKSLREEKGEKLSNFGRSLSKKYEELRKLNGLEKENGDKLQQQQQKKLEEVALDLLSGYWDARLNKSSHDLCDKVVNDGNYGVNHGFNYDHHEEDEDEDGDDDDGFSCSSSDLFELDHLSLIEDNELPVYETTQINNTKIM